MAENITPDSGWARILGDFHSVQLVFPWFLFFSWILLQFRSLRKLFFKCLCLCFQYVCIIVFMKPYLRTGNLPVLPEPHPSHRLPPVSLPLPPWYFRCPLVAFSRRFLSCSCSKGMEQVHRIFSLSGLKLVQTEELDTIWTAGMEYLEEFVAVSFSSVPEGGYGRAGSCGQRAARCLKDLCSRNSLPGHQGEVI